MGGPTSVSYHDDARNDYFINSQLPILKYRTDSTESVKTVLVHYLEWESAQVTYDSVYTAWPDTQSSVNVINEIYDWNKDSYPDLWYNNTDGEDYSVSGNEYFYCPSNHYLQEYD